MTCEQVEAALLDFVDGELSTDEADVVRAHVADCPACAAKLHDYRRMFGELSLARSLDNRAQRPEAAPPGESTAGHRGRRQIGDFELLDELGRGGMGVVYRARQVSLNRVVALKILAAGAVSTPRAIRRFLHEAQAAARLHHTNIVPVYAQGVDEGCYYYAMELIVGASLSAVLKAEPERLELPSTAPAGDARDAKTEIIASAPDAPRAPDASGSMTISRSVVRRRAGERRYRRIARLMAEVAEGLHHAHEAGIVHRDIKPQNLLLGHDDRLHITDFGLARLLDEPGVTQTSEIVGTPAYMAPEQISPKYGAIDRRTDVYSLGVTLYETLTRQRPFQAPTYDQTIHRVLQDDPTPPRKLSAGIPLDLETICLRAMEKEPARRFASAADFAAELRRYATDYPIQSRRVGPLGKAVRWVRRNKAKSLASAAMAVLLLLTPLLPLYWRSANNRHLDQTRAVLLDNYHDYDRAIALLDRVNFVGGDARKSTLTRAFVDIVRNPAESCRRLEPWVRDHPDDREALYLLAWACTRAGRSAGPARYAAARRHLDAGDQQVSSSLPDGAGYFFRGQALFGTDLRAARESFNEAIQAHPVSFPQAMMHQGRALNNLLYATREIEFFSEAEATLSALRKLRSKDAYPAYLLATAYQLRAEILRTRLAELRDPERVADTRRQIAAAVQAAQATVQEAIESDPLSPYGYMAAAHLQESIALAETDPARRRAGLGAAAEAWRRMPPAAIAHSDSARQERSAYLLRLSVWLNDFDAAEREFAERYRDLSEFDPDQAVIGAALACFRGDDAEARRRLEAGLSAAGRFADALLAVRAGYQLCRLPPPDIRSRATEFDRPLPPNWDAAWLRGLLAFSHGDIPWDTLRDAARDAGLSELGRIQRSAAAAYYQAAALRSAGRDGPALEAFRNAAESHDFENYCFHGRLWYEKLRLEAQAATSSPAALPK